MMIQNEQFRNCTVSFRTTSAHKIQLNKLAEASSMPTSEYLLHLTSLHPHVIDKMSGETIKEKELRDQVRLLQRTVTKLETDLENADTRIGIEQSALEKKIQEVNELKSQMQEKDAELSNLKQRSEVLLNQLSAYGNSADNVPIQVPKQPKSQNTEEVLLFSLFGLLLLGAIPFRR